MPLISIESVMPGIRLGLWKIDETVGMLLDDYPFLHCYDDEIGRYSSDRRRCEVLAVRMLIRLMVGENVVLSHDTDGKPYLDNGMHIGISHTRGLAAVIVSSDRVVSVDVEYVSERVGRVASRLLRSDERADTLHEKLLHWCVKETLYKLYSSEHLALSDMRVLSVYGNDAGGHVSAKNVQRDDTLNVVYRVFDGYMLTYAVL